MKLARKLLFIRSLLLCASFSIAAIGPATAGNEATIGFNAGFPGQARLTDHRTGKRYVVALKPEPDVHGTIDGVVLVLTREGGGNQNLLAPFGIYHGLQPYDLAALDFRRGPDNSTFGSTRCMPIQRTTTKLVVTLEHVHLRQVPGMPPGEGGSEEIASLELKVSLDEDRRPAR